MLAAMELDPIPWVAAADPHPAYRELRESRAVHHVRARDLFVLARHAHVAAALRDPETFASAHGIVPSGYVPETPTLIVLDGEPHARLRRTVQRVFTPRRMDALSARIRAFARQLANALEDGDVDAFARFTDPLPLLVMAELLGVDAGEHEMFKRCGDAIVFASGRDPAALVAAQRELTDYLSRVFAERQRAPRDDLISVLLSSSPEGEALREEDLLSLCFLLLVAGTETTAGALGTALLLLDRDRDARKRLLADPALLPTAVEEILRFDAPVHGLSRLLTRDVEIEGQTIPKGARVHLLFAAANRDPRAFAEPDRFDIARSPNPHVSFGFGVHFCLGASLARAELRIGLEEFLRRAPGYEVDTAGVVRLRSDTNRGFERLPISL
jgi:cytochrome P450